jgi:hypothetical protein
MAKLTKQIQNHSQFTQSDYDYFSGKGYTNKEIIAFWDRDAKSGNDPLIHKAAPKIIEYCGQVIFSK